MSLFFLVANGCMKNKALPAYLVFWDALVMHYQCSEEVVFLDLVILGIEEAKFSKNALALKCK